MAERPYVAGAVAIGVVAAVLHLGTTSAPTSSTQSSESSAGVHVRHSLLATQSYFKSWSDAMKDHPDDLGKLTARNEMEATISDFYSASVAPDSGDPSATSARIPSNALEVMIAIEPDPIHTQLSLLFDRDIDALEDALQASCYQYQSNWLPWSPPSVDSPAHDHFIGQEQKRVFLQGRESYPGVVLFRYSPNHRCLTKKPLAVFLVGNSPTAGIDRAQFETALSELTKLAPDQPELRILGPTFTGSGPSLRTLLSVNAFAKLRSRSIMIASGSVSDQNCEDLLPAGKIDRDNHCRSETYPGITFVSFGIDKKWRTDQIRSFLVKHGHFKREEIAELTEDESSYGEAAFYNDRYLHLYFPRNISHLSSAYQRNNIFGFGVSSQGANNISLNLDLNQAGDDDDEIPTFAQQQMPVSQDGLIHEITETLEQRHIRAIVLSATDVLDEVFVAELLARQAPDALVVINQADNLFLRSSAPNNFGDMYFVSPFPLIDRGQPENPIFPSDTSEGVYAATRYLFAPQHSILPYLPDYSSPVTPTNRPALWLSVVGHGDFWPIALLNDTVRTARSPFNLPPVLNPVPLRGGLHTEIPHLSQDLLVLCLCLLALYHTAKCLGFPVIQDLSFGYTINDAEARTAKLMLQFGITVLLLVALQVSVSPSYSSLTALVALRIGGVALCVAAAYLICLMATSALDLSPHGIFTGQSTKGLVTVIAIITVFTGVVFLNGSWALIWDWLSGPADPSDLSNVSDFVEYRASYPLRGISPTFPLFLVIVGFCILTYGHLDRLVFTPSLRPRLPEAVESLPNCPGEHDVHSVDRLLQWPPNILTITGKAAMFLVMLTVMWTFLKPIHLKPQMFDGLRLQKSLSLLMFGLAAAILWELGMAAVVWQKLKRHCLEPLEASPLRRGFSSVSGLTWSSLWIFRGSIYSRYRAINRLLEQAARNVLHDLVCLPKDGPNLEEAVKALRGSIIGKANTQVSARLFRSVQEQIALVAHQLLVELEEAWRKEEERITASDATEKDERTMDGPTSADPDKRSNSIQQLCEEWVALVYIHYIRMVLLQVRSRLVTAVALYLFLVWSATSYPYLNRHALLIALAALLGFLSLAVTLIYASINRDPILSRTTNHSPGRLDLDFYIKTISLVGIPLFGFVASQFPEVSSFLFSWLEPGMAAVK